jgi:hypothetical protein
MDFITIHKNAHDLTGRRFSRLVALGPVESRFDSVIWLCRCDCGSEHRVSARDLRTEHTRSCGCLQREIVRTASVTHGQSRTPTWKIWCDIRGRCNNKNNPKYGGRGIAVCERWQRFENFLADMGPKPSPQHSIERIDNNGDYSPGNCRWATLVEQANNKRSSRYVEAFGKRQTLAQWSRATGVSATTLRQRIVKLGWEPERAVSVGLYGKPL